MRTPLYTVELLYSNTLPTPLYVYSGTPLFQHHGNEDTSVYSGTPLFQHHGNEDTSVYSGTPLFQHHGNEDTSVYSEIPLFQHPEMRTPLYTVELLYSNTMK